MSVASSICVSTAGAWWLSRTLIGHRLKKDLERYKSARQQEIDAARVQLEGNVRSQVESLLAAQASPALYPQDKPGL